FENAFLEDDLTLQDMVLDDRTARVYDREGGLDLFSGEGAGNKSESKGDAEGGDDKKSPSPSSFFDDDALIDDKTQL
ncbi:MAG: hypothetical protein AAGC54_15720, partial [Cyanobacteria bacterium P01_F01_bin.4]